MDDELHRRLKLFCMGKGETIKEEITTLVTALVCNALKIEQASSSDGKDKQQQPSNSQKIINDID
jgi:hypothetical protein